MPKMQRARVIDGYLGFQQGDRFTPYIPLDSKTWFSWLDNHEGFAYEDESGRFTARCEQIKGKGAYWYAYRRHGKKVRKKYLGKTAKLTSQRLQKIAAALAETKAKVPPAALNSEAYSPLPKLPLGDVEASILATKFIPPALPIHLVNRSRLIDRLNSPITFVTAPAGYGKSTLVSQWLRQEQVPFIWMALDNSDDDPVWFWQVVFTAISKVLPQAGSSTVHPIRPSLSELIDIFQQIDRPHYLVLEDFHHIRNKTIQGDIAFLLEHLPQQLRIVLTSRTQAPFKVGRWRAKGSYVDLDADDLRFTTDEGVAFLSQKTDLAQHEALAMVAQTEGWATGLQLVALALGHQADLQRYLELPDKSLDYLKAYLLKDTLEHEPAHIQTFLLQIAILRTPINIDLCNAVTGQDNAATLLAYVEEQNLFVTVVPEQPGWYRLHQLIAKMLADLLLHRLPDQVHDLHLRAAHWYKATGIPEYAVRHLSAAQSWEEAAVLVQQHAPKLFIQGKVARLIRWLERLPLPVLRNYPLLVLTYARLRCDSQSKVNDLLSQNPADSSSAGINTMAMDISQLLGCLADLEQPLSEEEITADSLHTYSSLWQGIDLLLQSVYYNITGRWQRSMQLLEQIMASSTAHDHNYVTLQAAGMLAMRHVYLGRLQQSEQIINQLAQQTQRPVSQLSFTLILAQSLIYYERNQLDEAEYLLTAQFAHIDGNYQNEQYLRIRWNLTYILSASGQHEAAEKLMVAIIAEHSQKQISWLAAADLAASLAYLWLQHNKLALAEEWLVKSGLQVDGELTQEEGYSQLVHAHILIAQKRYMVAEKLLTNLSVAFPTGVREEPFLKLLLPLAITLFRQGKVNQAVLTLRKALRLAADEGYVRPFLELGSDMVTLLSLVGRQRQTAQAIKQHIVLLFYEFGQSGIEIPTITQSEMSVLVTAASITAREQELLQLVAEGLSNQEISQRLSITVNTVKSHLRRIYLKLEVQNRAQAVMKALELDLF
jgi:LuxR family maltose regulon positive regulatory protein